jgi:hypothetical protein
LWGATAGLALRLVLLADRSGLVDENVTDSFGGYWR